MENSTVKINFNKLTNISFGLEVEGIDATNLSVRFTIQLPNYNIQLNASLQGSTVTVAVPALPFLTIGQYAYTIEVIAQGYHFVPLTGTVDVVEEAKVVITAAPTSDVNVEDQEPLDVTSGASQHPPYPEELPFIFADNTREFTEIDVDSLDFKVNQTQQEVEPVTPNTDGVPTQQPTQTQSKLKLKAKLASQHADEVEAEPVSSNDEEEKGAPEQNDPQEPKKEITVDYVKSVLDDFNQDQLIKKLKADTEKNLDSPEERERKAQRVIQALKKEQHIKQLLNMQ